MEIQQLDWSKLKPSTNEKKRYLGSKDSEIREVYKHDNADRKAHLEAKQWLESQKPIQAKRNIKIEAKKQKNKARRKKQKLQHGIRKARAIERALQNNALPKT